MDLLVTDTHLDENPDNEYRWDFFRHVRMAAMDHGVKNIYHLGDLVDRKDRFPASFVNRLIDELKQTASITDFFILRGNHDTPLNGPAFFEFVNENMPRVHYVTKIMKMPVYDLILLPHTPNPSEDWRGINFSEFRAAFMHVTVTGAITENGYEIEHGTKIPLLPRTLRIYSGDVHVPQQCKNITYVGCPHPIKFGDEFPCRMLLLDKDYEIKREIHLDPVRKRNIKVSSIEELSRISVRPGDMARVEISLSARDVDNYSELEQGLADWAKKSGITIASHEFVIAQTSTGADLDLDVAPETLLRQFAEEEDVSSDLLAVGLELLEKVKK